MSSVLRTVKKRKKSRVLEEVQVVSRDECSGLELEAKGGVVRGLNPLGVVQGGGLDGGEGGGVRNLQVRDARPGRFNSRHCGVRVIRKAGPAGRVRLPGEQRR